jgi:predicted nucleic acid-binding protein
MLIDASALAAYILREEGWERVRDHLVQGVSSTGLVLKETLNAILMATRRRSINGQQARTCARALMALSKSNIKLVEQEDALDEAFSIAMRNNLTVYDAIYIALARKLRTALLTCDERQADSARREEVDVIEL